MSIIVPIFKNPNGKDCADWSPLKDGTKTGDPKYCDNSTACKQIGMRTDWYHFRNMETGELDFDYFCTGMISRDEDAGVDEEVS